jgi:hypothetical protein
MKLHCLPLLVSFFACCALNGALAQDEERTHTPEQMEALARDGDLTPEVEVRPAALPDLTKGEPLAPSKIKPMVWSLGPTGILGIMSGQYAGDQILVMGTVPGSPAEGKFQAGDVITGMNGQKFKAGGHLGQLIGNAIIEAEREVNAGRITFQVWRDDNYLPRLASNNNVANVDVDKLFKEAADDNTLYDWKSDEAKSEEVRLIGFDKFPLKPITFEVELKLRVFPEYSDTAPYDCPKTKQILEEAWAVTARKFQPDPKTGKPGKGGVIEAIALVASGKPEHRELVKQWVRSENSPWRPPTEPIGSKLEPGYKGYKGTQSWQMGFTGLDCAVYYDATGDDYVLPALRKFAIETAMGQSGGGTWGHTFAFPSFNGGELHRMNPGYGALNAAGVRCFFLIALAKKLGIEHPEIDAALVRSHRFFGSFVDRGAIPYGDHGAAGTDDSNGKNAATAFAFNLMGDKYGAKYFASMAAHASFTPRGGHAHDYFTNWSCWAASLVGPEIRIMAERNMRWRRTLCRRHDGSFVYHSPSWKYRALRDPTSTEILHQAVALKQTIITGKDLDESLFLNERELKQMIATTRGQFNDPVLFEKAGPPWQEASTDTILDMLDIFMPKTRAAFASELGKRYQAGEKEILPRLLKLMEHEEARFREGAVRAMGACGDDVVLSNLSVLIQRLDDPKEFVRVAAASVVSKNTANEEVQLALIKATVDEPQLVAPNGIRNLVQNILFAKDLPVAKSPFDAGFDEKLVEKALENLILLDPVSDGGFLGSRNGIWDKDTILRVAGPLVYAAEEEQINDQMFANRRAPALAILEKLGCREAVEASAHLIRKKAEIPRHIRPFSTFKRPMIEPAALAKQPGAFHEFIDHMEIILIDNPNEAVVLRNKSTNWNTLVFDLDDLLATIQAAQPLPPAPGLADEVAKLFREQLDSLDGTGAKLKHCRAILADPERKNTFHKLAAMTYLAETLGADALPDLLPYLGLDYWRTRDHSRKLATGLVGAVSADQLEDLLAKAPTPESAAGFLRVMAGAKAAAGTELARKAMKHESPVVRQAAIPTAFALGGDAVLPEILAHLAQATIREDQYGCEEALLSKREDSAHATRVRDAVFAMLPKAEESILSCLYYILGQLGDSTSLAELKKAARPDKPTQMEWAVHALSYSPSREADKIMLEIAAGSPIGAKTAGAQAFRRMVLGPKGYGDIDKSARMDFAEAMLNHSMDTNLVGYLSHIPEARAMRALMFCLRKGVTPAAENLVKCAESMENLPPADAKIAAKALQDVIEYIEVTRLRGGIEAHMDKDDKYLEWKALQARAGKALLKFHKPEAAPIEGFDTLLIEP